MGIIDRMCTVIKAKVSKVIDAAEDPREQLDYSYEKLLEQHQTVKRGVVDVTAAKKRLEIQREKLVANSKDLEGQAREAVAKQRTALAQNNEGVAKTCEDIARLALQRKEERDEQIKALDTEIVGIAADQQKLVTADRDLGRKIDAFRTRKEVIKAKYSASKAQVRVGESIAGIGEGMADIGITLDRAENRIEGMQARSAAIEEMIEVGTLEGFSGTEDDIARELAKIGATSGVDDALAKLKAEAVA